MIEIEMKKASNARLGAKAGHQIGWIDDGWVPG